MLRSGDACPKCGCQLKARTSKVKGGDYRTRYLRCSGCKSRFKEIVPESSVHKRRRRNGNGNVQPST